MAQIHCLSRATQARRWIGAAAIIASLTLASYAHAQDDTFTLHETGFVGIGTDQPLRQLHLKGSTANFRMDRTVDTAAFFLNRIDNSGNILRGFQVGTNTANGGEFIISDMADKSGGPGTRRMTITNTGEIHFTGIARAPEFVNTSSARYKDGIQTLVGASESVDRLRGVRFTWKETGEPSLGLIAEEVAEVFPEVVTTDADSGQAEAVNYAALTAVLVEALKEQGARLDAMETELARYRAAATTQEAQIGKLRTRVTQLEAVRTRTTSVGEDSMPADGLAALQTP